MNRIVKTITACVLALVMTAISPMTDLSQSIGGGAIGETNIDGATTAKAATVAKAVGKDDQGNALYISDIRIGNAYYSASDGPTEDQVVAELQRDGYTVLRDGEGYADLNAGADAPSIKEGPNKKKVFLGYKTTTDPDDAITDLAVMNMNGGYSVEEYKVLMQKQMDSQIKPFMDRFIDTLEEYRENYKKAEDTPNHIRADKMRRYLNCFTDDDTGGKPIGDLLLNKTKYEMGDAAYNKLSAEEKKDHADILTLLMQANGTAVLTIESLLTQAADTAEDTWYWRFMNTTVDDLVEEIQDQKPNLKTKSELYQELDKKYQDTAKEILKKWEDFTAKIKYYSENVDEVVDSIGDNSEKVKEINLSDVDKLTKSEQKETLETSAEVVNDVERSKCLMIASCLDSTEYGDGTLYDFFTQDYKDISEGNGIRKLYPMVEALSAGQIAGLSFVSMEDMFCMGLTGSEGYEEYEAKFPDELSVYEGVNREIYDEGGVALTSDVLRANAMADSDENNIFGVSDMSGWLIASWVATGVAAGGLAFSIVKLLKDGKAGTGVAKDIVNPVSEVAKETIKEAATVYGTGASMITIADFPGLSLDTFESIVQCWNYDVTLMQQFNNFYDTMQMAKMMISRGKNVQYFSQQVKDCNIYCHRIKDRLIQLEKECTRPSGIADHGGTDTLPELEPLDDATGQSQNQVDDVVDELVGDKADDAAEGVSAGSSWAKGMAIGFSIAMVVFLTVSIVLTVLEVRSYYKTNYSMIPKYIVDEVDITATNDKGERIMIQNQTAYYKVVTCNRIEGKSDAEKDNYKAMRDRNDLNGDIGKQWLALYAVKYKNGTPILADSLLYQKDSSSVPSGYSTGIHEFGGKAAANLNKKLYLYSSDPPSIRVYFKNADPATLKKDVKDTGDGKGTTTDGAASGAAVSGAAGSIFGSSGAGITPAGLALGGGIGIVLGTLLGMLIMYFSRRRKVAVLEKDERSEQ